MGVKNVWFDSIDKEFAPDYNKDQVKRCPFRTTKDGEFAPCYGSECMAYYDYDYSPLFYTSDKTHITGCRKFPLFTTQGCNNPA